MSGFDAPAASKRPQRVGVVLVHGVGETELGHSVNALAKSLVAADPGYTASRHSEVVRLADREAPTETGSDGAETRAEFRAVRRRLTHTDGTEVVLEGVHWSDLTNLKAGRFNALMGMFRVVFESHHIVHAMLDRGRDRVTAILRKLLLAASWLMRGPLAGLTIATSAICAVLMFGPVSGPIGSMDVGSKFKAVQLVLLASGLGLMGLVAWARDVSWYDTVLWLIIVSAGFLVLESVKPLPDAVMAVPGISDTIGSHCFKDVETSTEAQSRSLKAAYKSLQEIRHAQADGCYINGPYRVIAYGWRVWGLLLVVSIGLLLVMIARGAGRGQPSGAVPAAASIGIVIMQFVLWTLLVVTLIFPMLNRAEAVKDLMEIRQQLSGKVDIRSGAIAKMMQFPAVDLDWIVRFKFVYGAAATTLMGFLLIVVLISARRTWLVWRYRSDLDRGAERMPTLLFNRWQLAWLMLAVMAVIAFIMVTQTPENDVFEVVKSIMLVIAAGAAALTPALLLEQVSNGVHIARDVIDHQFNPRLEAGSKVLKDVFATRAHYPRRSRIHARVEAVMERMGRDGPFDRMILAGHSQGSVVVFDYMLERHPFVGALARERPMVLTVGSPLASIYQRYFREYLGRSSLSGLSGKLARWTNLFRIDDFVGGRIPAGHGIAIENVTLKAGGHMRYWDAPEVGRALDDMIKGPAAPAEIAAPAEARA